MMRRASLEVLDVGRERPARENLERAEKPDLQQLL
jgi:hypothetical protein